MSQDNQVVILVGEDDQVTEVVASTPTNVIFAQTTNVNEEAPGYIAAVGSAGPAMYQSAFVATVAPADDMHAIWTTCTDFAIDE